MLPALPPAHPSSLPPEAADVTTNICHYVWVLEEGTDLIAFSWAVLVWDSPSREVAWGSSQAQWLGKELWWSLTLQRAFCHVQG